VAAVLRASCLPRSDVVWDLSYQLAGAGHFWEWVLTLSVDSAAPATHADVTASSYYDTRYPLDHNTLELGYSPGGMSLRGTVWEGNLGAGHIGESVWIALWRSSAPASGDAPIAVAGPFVVDGA
jgi:hypothetical protein